MRASILSVPVVLALFCGIGCGDGADAGPPSTFATNPPSFVGNGDPTNSVNGVDGGFSTDPNAVLKGGCATATARAARQAVYMLVVVDGSGSMAKDNKWAAIVPALDAFVDDAAKAADPQFAVGLTVFSDTQDHTNGNGPYPTMDVPMGTVDANHATALHARIDAGKPKNMTPTLAVLSGQYPVLESFAPTGALQAGGKRVLVLMTDGVPYPNTDQQQPLCIAAATEEAKKGISTFAVGIGNLQPLDTLQYDPAFMGALAEAGGTANPGCNPNETSDPSKMCHFQVTPGGKSAEELSKEFIDAINAIRGAVASCEFQLDKGNGAVDPSKVNVLYTDGSGKQSLIASNATDGWTYDDPANPTRVILHGQSCAEAKADPNGRVDIVLGCKSVIK